MRTLLLGALTFLMVGCQPVVTAEPDAGVLDAGVVAVVDAGIPDAGLMCGAQRHLGDAGCVTEVTWVRGRFGPEGRDHHATWLWPAPDGGAVLVVAGGIDKWQGLAFNDTFFARVDAAGVVQPWEPGPEMPSWQTGMALEASGARAYSIGGMTLGSGNVAPTGIVQSIGPLADGTPDDWREELSLPQPTFYPSAARVGDWLFVFGGRTGSGTAVANVWRSQVGADGVLSDWVAMAALPQARTHAGAFVVGTRVYLVGGFDAASFSASQVNHRDLLTANIDATTGELGAWSSVLVDFEASSFSVAMADGWVYVMGGFDGSLRLQSAVRRAKVNDDGTLGAFEFLASLPLARAHVRQAPVRNGFIYSFGGSSLSETNDALHVGTLW